MNMQRKSPPSDTRTEAARPTAPNGPGSGAADAGAIIERLRAMSPSLPPKAGRIAAYLADNAAEVVHMSVTEVATALDVSEGSVISLCREAGVRGFQHLKIALARDTVRPVAAIHEDLEPDDTPKLIIEKIIQSGVQALQDTLSVLDANAVERAAGMVRRARRVEVYGIGSAAPIAEDAAYRLLRVGVDARAVVDSHIQAVSAAMAGPDVAVLTISHSGSTHETLAATRLAREAGATIISITNYGRSPLVEQSDVVLNTMARETRFRTEAMTSRIAQCAVVDALVATVALADFDHATSALRRTAEVLSLKRT